MCKPDFKTILLLWWGYRESTSNKTFSTKKNKFSSNFRKFGVNYNVFTERAIFT